MASLNKHGTEWFRTVQEVKDLDPIDKCERTTTYLKAYMSDGVVLRKIKIETVAGFSHDYGWKRFGKLKVGLTRETALEIARAREAAGGPKVVVVDRFRGDGRGLFRWEERR